MYQYIFINQSPNFFLFKYNRVISPVAIDYSYLIGLLNIKVCFAIKINSNKQPKRVEIMQKLFLFMKDLTKCA